uniref:F-box/LRR-repeat protein 16 n=1 Tax=Glossina pallidipes TaxID=7398 RepID=A0A1B0A6Y7_GLOPL
MGATLCSSLFELELAGCNEVTEAGLWACLTPRIVSLSLADCINIADEAVGAVAQLLPSLYEFSLQAYHVTDAALGYFSPKQSHSLSILRLQSCWELTNHGIVNIVVSLKEPHFIAYFEMFKMQAQLQFPYKLFFRLLG